MHIIGGNGNSNKHYKYNGDSWEEVCKTSLFTSYSTLCPIICNNEIHIFLIKSDTTYHYKFNGIEWSEVENFLPKFDGKTVVYYRGEIHLLGGYCYNGSSICRSHYKYNGVEWIEVSTLPFNLQKGYAFVINDELHIFGGSTISGDDYTRGWNHHYKWDGIEWTNVEDIPINYEYFKMSLFNSEIHIFSDNSNKKLHYTFGKDFSDLSNADILTVTIDGNKEVPLLVNKMSKNNPTGTGSLSLNRAEGSEIGENSVALGNNCIASYDYSSAIGECCVSGNYNRYQFNMSKITENDITKIQLKITGEDSNQIFSENDDVFIILEQDNKHRLYKCKILSVTVTDGLNNDYDHYLIIEDKNNYFSSMNSFHGYLFKSFDVTGSRNINYSHSEGYSCLSSGYCSHAEGEETNATSYGSHAEGYNTYANGVYSHAEGDSCRANGNYSHAEGEYSYANGNLSHAENHSYANGSCSHSEGYTCKANGEGSHAEGDYTVANGIYSHSEGEETIASSDFQHVQGMYNVEDTSDTYAHIVGGGTSNDDRKNIHTLDWNGNAVFSGDVTATKSDGTEVSLLSLKSTLDSIQVQNFYTGIEAPSNTLGEDGDLYLIT